MSCACARSRTFVAFFVSNAVLLAHAVNAAEQESPSPSASPPSALTLGPETSATAPQGLPTPNAAHETPSGAVENSVVKIFVTQRAPDFSRPWARAAPTNASATGTVIEENRILTNAHVIVNASEIQV